MEHPDFKTYLKQKKIDPKDFAAQELEKFMELKKLYDQVHPNSFTAQKLFLIKMLKYTICMGYKNILQFFLSILVLFRPLLRDIVDNTEINEHFVPFLLAKAFKLNQIYPSDNCKLICFCLDAL